MRALLMNHDHFIKVWIKCCGLKNLRNTHIYTQKIGYAKPEAFENMIVTRLLLLLLCFISIQFNSLFLHFTFDSSHLLDSLTSELHLNLVNSFLFSAEIWFLVEKKQCSQFIPVTWNLLCTCLRLSGDLNGKYLNRINAYAFASFDFVTYLIFLLALLASFQFCCWLYSAFHSHYILPK